MKWNPLRGVCGLALMLACVSGHAQKYTVTNLGSLGGFAVTGYGINASGEVTGNGVLANGDTHAVVYSNGRLSDVGTLGGTDATGRGINASGQATGYSTASDGSYRAFLYSNGVMQELGTLGGSSSYGYSINESGQMTGAADVPSSDEEASHAYLYADGTMKDLGTLGGSGSAGASINASGVITGASFTTGDTGVHAFVYSNGVLHDLGTLGGLSSYGWSVNATGEITGSADSSDGTTHAFIYSNGAMHDLGTLGGVYAVGNGINATGQVTGEVQFSDSTSHAFLYQDGQLTDLNVAIGTAAAPFALYAGQAINDRGQILAEGFDSATSKYAAFLLTPASLSATKTQLTTAADSVVAGASVSLTALVTPASGASTPTGTVTFSSGGAVTGMVTLNATAQATLTTKALPVGSDSVTAQYSGDASHSSSVSNAVTITVTQSTSPTASVKLSATSLAFGNEAVNTISASKSITVTNNGTLTLTLGSIALSGGQADDFSLAKNCGTSLAAGVSCTISIAFAPVSTGAKSAFLHITDNASGSPQSVTLTGTGLVANGIPVIQLSATALVFGNETVKGTSASKAVTVSNTGTAPLTLSSIALTGGQADDFALTKTCGGSLTAGASCAVSITFAPVSAGSKSAFLHITDNASGSPQAVSLSGTGVSASDVVAITSRVSGD